MPPGITGELNTLLAAHPEALLKAYAICPPSDIGSYKGKYLERAKVGVTAPATRARMGQSTRSEDIKLARVEKTHKIAYINLQKQPHGDYTATGIEGGDRIYFDSAYVNPGGWVPVYWLPWNTAGAAIRLTIPARVPGNASPDIFFTAAINGCSVFFQGTAQNPTIYHCGGDTGQGVDSNAGAQFWQEVVAEFVAYDATRGKNKGALAAQEVNKTQYIKTPGVGDGPLKPGEGKSTVNAQAYKSWLENADKNVLRIESVNPWACVMGVRRGNDWTFYLQENATVIYHQLFKKNFLSKTKASETRYVARPMVVSEVFPNGRAIHRVTAPIPRIL